MKIETKFKIGQEVFLKLKKKVYSFKIERISIKKDLILYSDLYYRYYSEEELFATKEEAEQKLKEVIK